MAFEDNMNLTIKDLELSRRSTLCLERALIFTVNDLFEKIKTPHDLLSIRNLGRKSAEEIQYKLNLLGIPLFMTHAISEEELSHKITLPIIDIGLPEKLIVKLQDAGVYTVSDLMYNLISYEDIVLFDLSEDEIDAISENIRSMGLRLGIFNEPISCLGILDDLSNRLEAEYTSIQDILKAGFSGIIDSHSADDAIRTANLLRKCGYLLVGFPGYDNPETCKKLRDYFLDQPISFLDVPDRIVQRFTLAYGDQVRIKRLVIRPAKSWFLCLQNYEDCITFSKCLEKLHIPVRGMDEFALGEKTFLQTNSILYTPLEELSISKKLQSLLVDKEICSVTQLVSFSAAELRDQKIVGDAALSTIRNVLYEGNLLLKDDYVIRCPNCSNRFISDILEATDCPDCIAKKKRISKISKLEINLSGPEYGSYTDLSSGFTLFANMKNTSSDLVKVRLVDFYIVEDDKQISPNWFLTGYSFNEEMIMPATVKSAGKIWSTERFKYSSFLSSINTYAVLVIRVASEKYKRMYKFAYDNDTWILEDYFTVY